MSVLNPKLLAVRARRETNETLSVWALDSRHLVRRVALKELRRRTIIERAGRTP